MLRRKKIHGDLRHLSKWMNRDHNRSDRQLQRTPIQMLCKRATFNRTLLFTGNQGQELRGGQDPGISESASLTKTRGSPSSGRFFPSTRMSNLHEAPGPRRRDTHKVPFSWAISNRAADFGISFESQNTASLLGSRLEILTA